MTRWTPGATLAVVGFRVGTNPDHEAEVARATVAHAYLASEGAEVVSAVGRYLGADPEPCVVVVGPRARILALTLGRALSQESVYYQSGGRATLHFLADGYTVDIGRPVVGPDPMGVGETVAEGRTWHCELSARMPD